MNCGLLGKSLKHSYSPQIHRFLGEYAYHLFEREPEELQDFILNRDYTGLNVTIPYKKEVIPFCTELTERAKKLGSVNTIVKRADGSRIGHNTDYFGFRSMVEQMNLSLNGKKVLVLGSGGASVTAVAVMEELGAKTVVISRTGTNHYGNLYLHKDASVIVNTTPVGMYPNAGLSPINLDLFPQLEGVLDIVYNPARTRLLLDAEERNIPCMNGLWMLIAQAKEASEWFTGEKICDDIIETIHTALKTQMENIILIGMPGCGKSTVGKLLSQRLGKPFVDTDAEIEKLAGMPIPQIFAQQGENAFREWETAVLKALGQQSGLIVATGGGCVTRPENYALLHQNGTVFWLQREISALATDGRPLSKSGNLKQMYQHRKPMYERFADCAICNDGTAEETAEQIIKRYTL